MNFRTEGHLNREDSQGWYFSEFDRIGLGRFLLRQNAGRKLALWALLFWSIVLLLGHYGKANYIPRVFELSFPVGEQWEKFTLVLKSGYLAEANHGLFYLLVAPLFLFLAHSFLWQVGAITRTLIEHRRLVPLPPSASFTERLARWNTWFLPIWILAFCVWVPAQLFQEYSSLNKVRSSGYDRKSESLSKNFGYVQAWQTGKWCDTFGETPLHERAEWLASSRLWKEESPSLSQKFENRVAYNKLGIPSEYFISLEARTQGLAFNTLRPEKAGRIYDSGHFAIRLPDWLHARGVALDKPPKWNFTVLPQHRWDAQTVREKYCFEAFLFLNLASEACFQVVATLIVIKSIAWIVLLQYWLPSATTSKPNGTIFRFMREVFPKVFAIAALGLTVVFACIKPMTLFATVPAWLLAALLFNLARQGRKEAIAHAKIRPDCQDPTRKYGMGEIHAIYNAMVALAALGALGLCLLLLNSFTPGVLDTGGGHTQVIEFLSILLVVAVVLAVVFGPMTLFSWHLATYREKCIGRVAAKGTTEWLRLTDLMRSQWAWPWKNAWFVTLSGAVIAFCAVGAGMSLGFLPGELQSSADSFMDLPRNFRELACYLASATNPELSFRD